MSSTPRQRKHGACFEVDDSSMGADQGEETKYGSKAPLVSEVTRRYKVRAPPAQSWGAGPFSASGSI